MQGIEHIFNLLFHTFALFLQFLASLFTLFIAMINGILRFLGL